MKEPIKIRLEVTGDVKAGRALNQAAAQFHEGKGTLSIMFEGLPIYYSEVFLKDVYTTADPFCSGHFVEVVEAVEVLKCPHCNETHPNDAVPESCARKIIGVLGAEVINSGAESHIEEIEQKCHCVLCQIETKNWLQMFGKKICHRCATELYDVIKLERM